MKTEHPFRNKQDLKHFMDYYRCMEAHPRNYLLIVMGVNTALRISDLLRLRWRDVYDEMHDTIRRHIFLVESKTGKASCIFVNAHIREALLAYRKSLCTDGVMTEQREVGGQFLFCGKDGSPISRVQAYRIIRKAAEQCQLPGTISPHSMRKTFGYHAWKQGIPPVLLMEIYHHSSFTITKRYLGIDQDDRDEVFKNICL